MEDTGRKSKRPKTAGRTAQAMRSNVVGLLAGESQQEKDAIHAMWHSQYGKYIKVNQGMISLLNSLVDADWMQKRAMRVSSEAVARLMEAEANGSGEEVVAKLERKALRWARHKASWETSFQRALRAVEQFLGRRRRESMQQQKIVLRIHEAADIIASRRLRDGRFPPVEGVESGADVKTVEKAGETVPSGQSPYPERGRL